MTVDSATALAILAMGIATYATRIAGFWLVRHVNLPARAMTALDAVPGAILMAVITPMIFTTGPAETLAAAITALAAMRLPLLGVAAVGVVAVVLLRLAIG